MFQYHLSLISLVRKHTPDYHKETSPIIPVTPITPPIVGKENKEPQPPGGDVLDIEVIRPTVEWAEPSLSDEELDVYVI